MFKDMEIFGLGEVFLASRLVWTHTRLFLLTGTRGEGLSERHGPQWWLRPSELPPPSSCPRPGLHGPPASAGEAGGQWAPLVTLAAQGPPTPPSPQLGEKPGQHSADSYKPHSTQEAELPSSRSVPRVCLHCVCMCVCG
jgi:hypothetical protein